MAQPSQAVASDFQPADLPGVVVWRLSVEQYHEMIRTGILTEDDPVELLNGWLVPKMTKTPRHRMVTKLVYGALEDRVPQGWYVDSQEPVTLAVSEPEPDVVIVRGQTRDYADRHPGPGDVGLVVEVSDSSLDRDSEFKRRIYAEARIPHYWVVNLIAGRIETYAGRSAESAGDFDYQRRDYVAGESVPVFLDGQEVSRVNVSEILP
jgi:Uma2 family endonuclease